MEDDKMKDFKPIGELFKDKKNRDKRYKELKKAGLNVRRTTSRNQTLHPQYIEDYEGEYNVGFGNTDYKTSVSVLYKIERGF